LAFFRRFVKSPITQLLLANEPEKNSFKTALLAFLLAATALAVASCIFDLRIYLR